MPLNRSFRKKATVILGIAFLLFLAIQFIRPSLANPPVTADLSAPAPVKAILKRACYDCHSNETRLAWFDQPAPAYWLVVDHVKDGRKVLNFSNWDSLSKDGQTGKLFESLNQLEFGVMPIPQYAWFHHGARISGDDITILRQYLNTLAPILKPDSTKQKAADDQYGKWVIRPFTQTQVSLVPQPALNGLAYISGYDNWEAISTSQRWDNGTMRVIFGNDVAVKAIRAGQTHPWPNGATFAKVAWDQLIDSVGEIRIGAFKQVEFMVRDNDRYASTEGWGWGRWRGIDLAPYGKNAVFTTECLNCHKPMQENDHVFTIPTPDTLQLYDQASSSRQSRSLPSGQPSSLPDSLAGHPLAGKVISAFINTKDHTMSILYGNDTAVRSARTNAIYPPGAVLTLVTWSQRDDPHWYGARIPDTLRSVERIIFDSPSGVTSNPAYERYEGPSLKKSTDIDPATVQRRTLYITGRKAAVLPGS